MASTLRSVWYDETSSEAAAAAGALPQRRRADDSDDDGSGCSSSVGALEEERQAGREGERRVIEAAVSVESAVDAFYAKNTLRRVLLCLARASLRARGRRRIADSR